VYLERTWKIMMAVMARAAMCAKSVAAWKMMVLASSMDRAEQEGRRSGLCEEVSVEGGPRTKHKGRGDCSQSPEKDPNPIVGDSR
jgi:hypothetical protein